MDVLVMGALARWREERLLLLPLMSDGGGLGEVDDGDSQGPAEREVSRMRSSQSSVAWRSRSFHRP